MKAVSRNFTTKEGLFIFKSISAISAMKTDFSKTETQTRDLASPRLYARGDHQTIHHYDSQGPLG